MKHITIAILAILSAIPFTPISSQSSCDPLFRLKGLYDPSLPNDQELAIFGDDVKDELMINRFDGKDKEYGDIDGDGDIDILYLNAFELWAIINAGSKTVPDYRAVNKVFTGLTNVISFRFVDWYADSINDLVVMDEVGGNTKISLYLDIAAQIPNPTPSALFIDETQFPINNAQLIEVGDVNGDHFPELFVSGQGTTINGTALFQLNGTGWTFPPSYEFFEPQTFDAPLIVETGLSFPVPELFDADCDGDLDLFISDSWWVFEGGGHVDYYENTGPGSPLLFFTHVNPNPFGLDDVPLPGMELTCDWVVTRFVDFFGDGFPEAIAYNPCNQNTPRGDMFYYRNVLEMDTTSSVYSNLVHGRVVVSPNPVDGELTVQSDDIDLEALTTEVIDYLGRTQPSTLLYRSPGKLSVDVGTLSQGVFFLRLMSNGKLVKVVRFVKVG